MAVVLLRLNEVLAPFVVGFTLAFLVTYFSLKKVRSLKPAFIILVIWLGFSTIESYILIRNIVCDRLEPYMFALPIFASWTFGIVTGFLSFKIQSRICRALLIALSFFAVFWFAIAGYDFYLHKLNYGTFPVGITEHPSSSIVLLNERGEEKTLKDLGKEYIVLDFWNSSCGICYATFPILQKSHDRWLDDDRIHVYGVFCYNVQQAETPQTGFDILRRGGYTFPALSMDIHDEVLNELGATKFPTVIIFDSGGNLIFRGSIEYAENYLDKLTRVP